MEEQFIEDQSFKGIDFTSTPLPPGQYEACTFADCNFLNADLSRIRCIDCSFLECNLSTAKLVEASLQGVVFKACKLLGLRFDTCSDFAFSVRFERCQLQYAVFYQQNLSKTVFEECELQDVDFTACNLKAASFSNCNLHRAVFEDTNLQQADFRGAINFTINPEYNTITGAKFDAASLGGLLTKHQLIIDHN